jgi:hypothetical protein
MPATQPKIDAREVDRVEALVTVPDDARTDDFLDASVPGSSWQVQIRTASVAARLIARVPLGNFDERVCTCLRLRLDRAVPVEPGLRFTLHAADDPTLEVAAIVRPWRV